MSDLDLDRILQAARQAPDSRVPTEDFVAPPGYARGLVSRWLTDSGETQSESWVVISRRGLALALGLMVTSMLWHAWVERGPVLMESTASDTVLLSIYPQ